MDRGWAPSTWSVHVVDGHLASKGENPDSAAVRKGRGATVGLSG